MLSGRYRTCWLCRHWSGNTSGNCEVPGCTPRTPGTLAHIATGQCAGLTAATTAAAEQWANFISLNTYLLNLFRSLSEASQEDFLAFLLNPTTHPEVLSLAQQHGRRAIEDVSFMTRSWLYEAHTMSITVPLVKACNVFQSGGAYLSARLVILWHCWDAAG